MVIPFSQLGKAWNIANSTSGRKKANTAEDFSISPGMHFTIEQNFGTTAFLSATTSHCFRNNKIPTVASNSVSPSTSLFEDQLCIYVTKLQSKCGYGVKDSYAFK